MKKYTKIIMSTVVALATVFGGFAVANAQVYYNVPTTYATNCVTLTYNFGYGYQDISSGGDITMLQQFLASQGYMTSSLATGYFGNITLNALQRYQREHNLPVTGRMDDATRVAIQNQTCG